MAIVVNSMEEAWKWARLSLPGTFTKDPVKSERAGYPVYTTSDPEESAWISDLGDRLEINSESSPSVNIWVSRPQKFTKKELTESLDQITKMVSAYLKIPEEISKEFKLTDIFGELAGVYCNIENYTRKN